MIEFIKSCGIIGFLILGLTPLLLLAGVLTACLGKSRKSLAVFAVFAFIPILLGLLGTAAGYSHAHGASEMIGSSDEEIVQLGLAQARYTTYLGTGATALILMITGVAMAGRKIS